MTPPKPTLENFLPSSSPNQSTPERMSKIEKTDESSETAPKIDNADGMEIEDDSKTCPKANDNVTSSPKNAIA